MVSLTKLDEVDERDGQNASKYKDLNLNYTKDTLIFYPIAFHLFFVSMDTFWLLPVPIDPPVSTVDPPEWPVAGMMHETRVSLVTTS